MSIACLAFILPDFFFDYLAVRTSSPCEGSLRCIVVQDIEALPLQIGYDSMLCGEAWEWRELKTHTYRLDYPVEEQ